MADDRLTRFAASVAKGAHLGVYRDALAALDRAEAAGTPYADAGPAIAATLAADWTGNGPALALYALVALIWFLPDPRIERQLHVLRIRARHFAQHLTVYRRAVFEIRAAPGLLPPAIDEVAVPGFEDLRCGGFGFVHDVFSSSARTWLRMGVRDDQGPQLCPAIAN